MKTRRFTVTTIVVSLLVVSMSGHPSLAAGEQIVAPYAASGVDNACAVHGRVEVAFTAAVGLCLPSPGITADRQTGKLTAHVQSGPELCPLGCTFSRAAWGGAWIRAVHQLPSVASQVNYRINLDVDPAITSGRPDGLGSRSLLVQVDARSQVCDCGGRTERLLVGGTNPPEVALPERLTIPVNVIGSNGSVAAGPIDVTVLLFGLVNSGGANVTSVTGGVTVASIEASTGSTIALQAAGYKVKGKQKVDLNWTGASSSLVEVFRNDAVIASTENDGAYTDNINRTGGGTYAYRICEQSTDVCSNEVQVVF